MIRSLLIFFVILILYYAVKTVIRSAFTAYREEESPRARQTGNELVQDPQCRTYVIKERAVTRRIRGKLCSFCSEACARQYEELNRN